MEERIVEIMSIVQIAEDGTVTFTEEAKKLIHDVSEECRKLPLYQQNKDKKNTYEDGITADQVYLDMCNKIVQAPTLFHMLAVPKLLLPVIDDKLKGEVITE